MSTDINFSGSVPQNYDTYLGPLLFEPFAIDLVSRIKVNELNHVLELACGTGRVTHHLLRKLNDHANLTATDLNADMIAVAETKIKDERVKWQVTDAQQLPFGDNEFDLIVCQFGVMFFEDKLKAFKEIKRVLSEGSIFLFNTWDKLEYNTISNLSQQVMYELIKDDPPRFFEKGPFSFFDQQEIHQLLQEAGFTKISFSIVNKKTGSTDIDHIVKGFLDGSPLTNYLKKIDAPMHEIRLRLKQLITENAYTGWPMQAIVCEAVK